MAALMKFAGKGHREFIMMMRDPSIAAHTRILLLIRYTRNFWVNPMVIKHMIFYIQSTWSGLYM
jgi:hypothetical protein